jgi:predicted ABC-type ATPase
MAKPILIVIAGANGAGKTYATSQILKHEWVANCLYINPDFIAQEKFGDWNSKEMVLKAAQYAQEQREDCLKHRKSLIFETVLSATEKIDFIEHAKRQDFFVRLFYIGTDTPQINASRVAQRVMNNGHDVPIQKIISRYYKSLTNCVLLAKFVDRLYVYDNSIEDRQHSLLFRATNGKLTKQYAPINDWAKPIYEIII